MNTFKYSEVNVLISVYESRLLAQDTIEKILHALDVQLAFKYLNETTYGDFIRDDMTPYQFEHIFEAELKRVYRFLYAKVPDARVVDIFALRYDYHNLKVLVKSLQTHQDFSDINVPLGKYKLQELKNVVFEKQSAVVDTMIVECVQSVFQYIEDYQDIQNIDIIFDEYYWKLLQKLATEINEEIVTTFVNHQINLFNILMLMRSSFMGKRHGFMSSVLVSGASIPAETLLEKIDESPEALRTYLLSTEYAALVLETGALDTRKQRLMYLDIAQDYYLMRFLENTRLDAFGAGPLLRYLFNKEIEIKNLRTILVCKINHVDNKILKERLRTLHA